MSWTHIPLHTSIPHLHTSQVVVSCGVLDSVVSSLSHESPLVQTAADGVVSAVARSTTDFAHRVMVAGGWVDGGVGDTAPPLHHNPPVQPGALHPLLNQLNTKHRYPLTPSPPSSLPPQPGALPPLLTQLNTASTPSAVKEAAVRALDSIIRSSEEHASVVCNPEVREGGTEGGRRWTCLLSAVRSAKAL